MMISRRQILLGSVLLGLGVLGIAAYWWMGPAQMPVYVPVPEPILSDQPLPTNEEFAELARTNPVAALDASIRRYRKEVQGYRLVLAKQEQIGGKLHDPEVIRVAFRESPFSVLMLWDQGARRVGLGSVRGTLYVAGENNGQMTAWRPDALFKSTSVGPRDHSARAAARFSIEEFGLYHAVLRTYRAWSAVRGHGTGKYEFLGTKPIAELSNRTCHVIRRTCEPDELDSFVAGEVPPIAPATHLDAFHTITIMLDAETWLQTGAELRKASGGLIASYYFRDIVLNPTFPADQFEKSALR